MVDGIVAILAQQMRDPNRPRWRSENFRLRWSSGLTIEEEGEHRQEMLLLLDMCHTP